MRNLALILSGVLILSSECLSYIPKIEYAEGMKNELKYMNLSEEITDHYKTNKLPRLFNKDIRSGSD